MSWFVELEEELGLFGKITFMYPFALANGMCGDAVVGRIGFVFHFRVNTCADGEYVAFEIPLLEMIDALTNGADAAMYKMMTAKHLRRVGCW